MKEIIIIGAGPAGLSAGLRAKELKINYLILEKGRIANTILETYPYGKLVTDFPKEEKVKGNFWFKKCQTEELLEKWQEIGKKLNIQEKEEVLEVKKKKNFFQVISSKGKYESKFLVIAIGKEGKPKRIGVKGEEKDKVLFRLKNPEKFKGKKVLVVGGGNSAIEAALALCEYKSKVTLSYRKPKFFRLNEKNLCEISEKCDCGDIETIFNSKVEEIKDDSVILNIEGKRRQIKNNFVFIFAGSELAIDFFKKIEGLEIKDKKVVLDENNQTSLKNLFVIGDAAGRPPYLIKPAINQGYEVIEFINSRLREN